LGLISFLELARDILPQLLAGFKLTLELTILSLTIGGALGIFLALGRVFGNKLIYSVTTTIVEVIRGTPLLVQLFILYYGLSDIGIMLSPFTAAVIAFSINTSAYQGEYLRGALLSVDNSQMMAARSIGMSKAKAIRYILLPQALRIVIPPWTNEAILMLKFTSIAFMVTVPELMATGRLIATRNFRYLELFTIIAIIYLVSVLIFSYLFDRLERKVSIPGLEMR